MYGTVYFVGEKPPVWISYHLVKKLLSKREVKKFRLYLFSSI